MRDPIPLDEHLEVIEGLLALAMKREEEIRSLLEEIERLKLETMQSELNKQSSSLKERKSPNFDRKVLVADPSDTMRAQLVNLFKSNGFSFVVEASDGHKALSQFRTHKPSIVTLDSDLGELSGYHVAKAIKSINRDVIVVLISDIENEFGLIEAVRAGVNDVITKPVNYNRLLKIVGALDSRKEDA